MQNLLRAGAFAAVTLFAGANLANAATIYEAAGATDDLSTLATAVDAAGLADTLNGEGPFTVFAPTNAAFDALPAGALDGLLADTAALAGVITYHAVAGEIMAADLIGLLNDNGGEVSVETVAGGTLTAALSGDSVVLTDAQGNEITVVATDVDASNGVVHVIDGVLLP